MLLSAAQRVPLPSGIRGAIGLPKDDCVLEGDLGGILEEIAMRGWEGAPGENLTGERLDVASIEMLKAFSDLGLRCFAEQCRHWQAMVEFELERRRST